MGLEFLLGVICGLAMGAGATYVLVKRQQPPAVSDSRAATPLLDELLSQKATTSETKPDEAAELRQSLRVKFLYDEDRVNQAIEAERQRTPTANDVELMRAAVYRWERENH